MLTATLLDRIVYGDCEFYFDLPKGYTYNPADFFFGDPIDKGTWHEGDVVVCNSGEWEAKIGGAQKQGEKIRVSCHTAIHADKIAFPIDPAMTAKDINGATRIYPNATNDGWLFAHAEVAHHHDRIITLEAVMHTLFEDLVHSKLTDVLKAVVGHNNPSPPIGTALLYNYNAQSGSLANYQTLVEFRKECVKWCSEVEKLLHVGQHVQEDDHTLKHQIVRAINQAKAVWKADTEGKARNLSAIEPQVNAIIARVEAEHEILTRWAKVARQEAEKKKAAAASNSETETENA